MGVVETVAAAAVSYLIGSIPVGYLVVKAVRDLDIRSLGSGNIGATNVARVLGRKWFFLVYFLDLLKGFLPCLGAGLIVGGRWNAPAPFPVVLCGLMAVVGHIWPVYLRFRGGKGVATSCGVCLYMFPLAFAVGLAVWIVALGIWRYVSLASIIAATAVAAFLWVYYWHRLAEAKHVLGFGTLAAALIIARHHANIRRLLTGTEHKVGRGARAAPEPKQ